MHNDKNSTGTGGQKEEDMARMRQREKECVSELGTDRKIQKKKKKKKKKTEGHNGQLHISIWYFLSLVYFCF